MIGVTGTGYFLGVDWLCVGNKWLIIEFQFVFKKIFKKNIRTFTNLIFFKKIMK